MIRDQEAVEQGFALLIDGIDWAWWSNEDVRTQATGIQRTTNHVGLRPPSVTMGTDLKTGLLVSSSARITIDDVTDAMAGLFASVRDVNDLSSRLSPNDAASLSQKHVGIEYIGLSGNRGQLGSLPGVGLEHPSASMADALGQARVPVSDDPMVFHGRRVRLYRFLRPPGGTFGDVADADLVWWGKMRDAGQVRGRTWSVSCDGPESWLRKTLNQGSFQEPRPIQADLSLTDDEKEIYVNFFGTSATGTNGVVQILNDPQLGPSTPTRLDKFGTASTTISGATVTALITSINSAITTAKNATENDGQFSSKSEVGGACTMKSDGAIYISIDDSATNVGIGSIGIGVVTIAMHEEVWRALGYTPSGPESQTLRDFESDDKYVFFAGPSANTYDGAPLPPGYYIGVFHTRGIGGLSGAGGPFTKFTWLPEFERPISIRAGVEKSGGQVIRFEAGTVDPVVLPQLDQAPAGSGTTPKAISGAGNVDSQRLFAAIGPRRLEGEIEEVEELVQIGRCSWVDSGGFVQTDGTNPAMLLTEWIDPYRFGLPKGKIASGSEWRATEAQPITMVPIASWARTVYGAADTVTDVIQSILLTTGTSTGWWTSPSHTTRVYGPSGYIAPGENNPGSALSLGVRVVDNDGADFGLGIPSDLVQPRYRWEQQLGGLEDPLLAAVRVAHIGPVQAEDMIRGLTQPLGWCWSLDGGQYGVFCPWDTLSPSDATVTLTQEDMAGNPTRPQGSIPSQSIRYRSPIDGVKIQERVNPWTGEYRHEREIGSTDRGGRYRTGEAILQIGAPYHENPPWFKRWRRGFDWWSRRHFEVRGLQVNRLKGQDLWPGTVVRITDPWLVSQLGVYGVTGGVGIVTSTTRNYARDQYTIDLLVQEPPRSGYRILAPEAKAYKYDSGTFTLTCEKDCQGVGGGHIDVAAFAKPSWAASADAGADIQVCQYIRGHLYQTLTGTISSVDTAANTITLTGALSGGVYYRDMDTIILLRDFANQSAAWVKEVFAPITDENGAVNGSTTDAVDFNDA